MTDVERLAEIRAGNIEPSGYVVSWLLRLLDATAADRDAGAKFKAFVHSYLDQHGVPHGDPENEHQKEGCRIGARLDLLFAQRDAALARVKELEREKSIAAALGGSHDTR